VSYTEKMTQLGWKTGQVRKKMEFELAENSQKTPTWYTQNGKESVFFCGD